MTKLVFLGQVILFIGLTTWLYEFLGLVHEARLFLKSWRAPITVNTTRTVKHD